MHSLRSPQRARVCARHNAFPPALMAPALVSLPLLPDPLNPPTEFHMIQLQGKTVGTGTAKLTYDQNHTPTLTVGNNLLHGKWVTLTKPLAVTKRQKLPHTETTNYAVVGYIKKKLVFDERPLPLSKSFQQDKGTSKKLKKSLF